MMIYLIGVFVMVSCSVFDIIMCIKRGEGLKFKHAIMYVVVSALSWIGFILMLLGAFLCFLEKRDGYLIRPETKE